VQQEGKCEQNGGEMDAEYMSLGGVGGPGRVQCFEKHLTGRKAGREKKVRTAMRKTCKCGGNSEKKDGGHGASKKEKVRKVETTGLCGPRRRGGIRMD